MTVCTRYRCFSVEDPEEIEHILNRPWEWFDEISPMTDKSSYKISVSGFSNNMLIVRADICITELNPEKTVEVKRGGRK